MERSLYFKKFRNIGLKKDERLVLNNTLEKGKMGNLIIVLGANNSGKSNVLDGLFALSNKNLSNRDVTNLSFNDDDRHPQISLVSKDDDLLYAYHVNYGKNNTVEYPKYEVRREYKFMSDLPHLEKVFNEFVTYINNRNYYYDRYFSFFATKLNKLNEYFKEDPIDSLKIENTVLQMMNEVIHYEKYDDPNNHHRTLNEYWRDYVSNKHLEELDNELKSAFEDEKIENKINDAYRAKYGMNFIPNVIKYQQKEITNSDLTTTIDSIESNPFFMSVLKKIDYDVNEIKNAYKIYRDCQYPAVLSELEDTVEKKLTTLSDDFNSLYYTDESKYIFTIKFETSSIFFQIFRGKQAASLDYQSTGFKWFFNLYFNLLCKTTLHSGDIIIMDEPATNLHVKGQQELRKFLKDFTMQNDLTIVLATHSPFLVDINYLDELRVVSNKDNISSICNDFTTYNPNDPDSLKPVKEALTVNNNILYDPDNTVIFVEGITDYNYFIAFKEILGIKENYIFLPIEGVGNGKDSSSKEIQQKISEDLIRIKKRNPFLLCDGDAAGKSMKKVNAESMLQVVTLTEIDETFKEIESLFDPDDLKKYKLNEKRSSTSSLIKNFTEEYKFSAKTKSNFKKVFDFLKNNLE